MNSSEVFRILPLDVIVFIAFVITVVTVGLLKSRSDKSSEGYFLAGRGLQLVVDRLFPHRRQHLDRAIRRHERQRRQSCWPRHRQL